MTNISFAEQAKQRSLDFFQAYGVENNMEKVKTPTIRELIITGADPESIDTTTYTEAEIDKAIEAANLGLNPSDDGRVIRLVFPQLTEERRKELVKDMSKYTESAKVTCRNARRDVLDVFKKMKKDSSITEDELSSLEKDVQKTLDDTVALIDKSAQEKEKEIMEV